MKRYIRAMASKRDKALQHAGFYSDSIIEHIIKIVVYSDVRKGDVIHWIDELSGWLHDVGTITLKPNGKKLKPKDIEITTFGWMGDELHDYASLLNMFQHDNKRGKFNYSDKESYPYVETTRELAQELMDVCYDVMTETIPMICDKNEYSFQQYKNALCKVFVKYL